MEYLLRSRDNFATEAEFRTYLFESARALATDLREVGIEMWVRPSAFKTAASTPHRDWNRLKIGCE
jgi:DNA-directed RNA polymerase specialized sigma24 family protein